MQVRELGFLLLQQRSNKPQNNNKPKNKQSQHHRSNHSRQPSTATSAYRITPSLCPSQKRTMHTINQEIHAKSAQSQMNHQLLYTRKQSHLNTCFNIRKNKLKNISKANRQILQRINSQSSLYSSRKMNESYQKSKEIKDRLSGSKISRGLAESEVSRSSHSSRKSHGVNVMKGKGIRKQVEMKATNITQASGK